MGISKDERDNNSRGEAPVIFSPKDCICSPEEVFGYETTPGILSSFVTALSFIFDVESSDSKTYHNSPFFVISGPFGAGKSYFLKVLNTFLQEEHLRSHIAHNFQRTDSGLGKDKAALERICEGLLGNTGNTVVISDSGEHLPLEDKIINSLNLREDASVTAKIECLDDYFQQYDLLVLLIDYDFCDSSFLVELLSSCIRYEGIKAFITYQSGVNVPDSDVKILDRCTKLSISHQSLSQIIAPQTKNILTPNSKPQTKIYSINNSEVSITLGDIIDTKCEVIVSSDDYMISMGGGVSMAIAEAAGQDYVDGADKYVPADLGSVVVTHAGNLPQKYVFHCISISDEQEKTQEFIISNCVRECLQLLPFLKITSIAFPAIGMGLAGFSPQKVAELMSEAIGEFVRKTNKRYTIELCLIPDNEHFLDVTYFSEALIRQQILCEHSRATFDTVENNASYNFKEQSSIQNLKEYDVFISYSRKDTDKAKELCGILEDAGIRFWIDREGIYTGAQWRRFIVKAIEASKVVIFMSSENSNRSDNVQKEISLAVESQRKIFPIKLDNTPYDESIRYDLTLLDYLVWEDVRNINFVTSLKQNISLMERNERRRSTIIE